MKMMFALDSDGAAPVLVLGPLLRYVSETVATIWAETDRACRVEILGRELPFVRSQAGAVLRGSIDLLYRQKGKVVVADYAQLAPNRSVRRCAISRAMMSAAPDGAKPTMMRTGRDGKVSARTTAGIAGSAAAAAVCMNWRRCSFVMPRC